MRDSRLVSLLLLAMGLALGQAEPSRHYLTVGTGVAIPAAGYKVYDFDTSPAVGVNYELRFSPYAGAEVGFDAILGSRTLYYKFGLQRERANVFLVPFGLRGYLPVGRFELSAGLGGARTQYSDSKLCCNCCGYASSWLVQSGGGIRVRLDALGRYRAGVSARLYRDVSAPTQQWIDVSGTLTYRLGR